MHYSKIDKLEDLQKLIDHLTAKGSEDPWNQIDQKIKDDLLRNVYENIAERSLQKAHSEVQAQKPKRQRRRKVSPSSDGEQGPQ